jgi:very-short-patch-repair endonuclease
MTVDPTDGQRRGDSTFRRRDLSGVPVGRDPRPLSRQLDALSDLVDSITQPIWCFGPTAAALEGMDGFLLAPPFHLVTLHGHKLHRFGHHIHVTRVLDNIDRSTSLGFPTTSPTRTLIDLAATYPLEQVTAALDSALRDGGTSEDFAHRRIAALRTQGRAGPAQLLRALEGQEIARGGQSWLEREFLRLIHHHGFPRPDTQQVLARRSGRLVRVDVRFPGTNVVVELLGYRWHRSRMQMQIDSERVNALQLAGFVVLQFTYTHVVTAAPSMFVSLRSALSGVPQNAA